MAGEGAARRRGGPIGESSVDTLAFPLVIEFGMNRLCFATDVSGSSFVDRGTELNERGVPFPPPRTRSGRGGLAGATCFGAGSIDSKLDTPAPLPSVRAFFVGGCSGSSSPSPPWFGLGRSIVIFFGRLACFGGGREIAEFGVVVGFVVTGLAGVVVVVSASESLSLPLPYPSTPSMTMMVDRVDWFVHVACSVRASYSSWLTFCHNSNKNNGDLPDTNADPKEEQQTRFASAGLLTTSRSTPSPKTTRDSEHWPVQSTSYISSHHSCTDRHHKSYS